MPRRAEHRGEGKDSYVRALARGLTILALFDIEHPDWSLSEVCCQTGMSKTTVYRLLRTLEDRDFLDYDPQTEKYHLGKATIPVAYLALSYVGFVRTTHHFLEELAHGTGETVELTVGTSEGAVVVDEVATRHPFRLNRPTGRILNDLANSSFRLHVAHRSLPEQEEVVGHAKWAGRPIDNPAEVLRRMAEEKAQGLAFDLEELDPGVCAASVPVYQHDGALRAVLTLVAPVERFGPRQRKRKVSSLQLTAKKITAFLAEVTGRD